MRTRVTRRGVEFGMSWHAQDIKHFNFVLTSSGRKKKLVFRMEGHGASAALEHGSLEQTPTWAVAGVCTVFVLLSLLLERGIHYCGKRLKRKNQKPLSEALEKMKEELMLMGFISLLLSVFQPLVAELCIPRSFSKYMLPCKFEDTSFANNTLFDSPPSHADNIIHGRKLLVGWLRDRGVNNRCASQGKVPIISVEGLHQLHIFIFVMAIVHLCYSCLTMLFGRIMVYWWRRWEDEIHKADRNVLKATYSQLRQKTFVRKHARRSWSTLHVFNWIASFMRHLLCKPVTRADYLTLRSGFVKNYNLKRNFDFHKYITRVLEDDFKVVVGISGYLWAFVIIFLLININGWHTYFWMAFIPLILILVIGAKLQYVITELACEIAVLEDKTGEEVAIKPRDDLFWFKRPRLLLHLIHFTLFQNAFELAFFFWVWATFGFDTCFMDSVAFIIVRLFVGLAVQVLCSYSTLPLYVIVTQMGSHYSRAIFTKRINKGVKEWHHGAKSNLRQGRRSTSVNQEKENARQPITKVEAEDEKLEQPSSQQMKPMKPMSSSLQQLMEIESSVALETVSTPVQRILEMELPPVPNSDFAVVEIVEAKPSI